MRAYFINLAHRADRAAALGLDFSMAGLPWDLVRVEAVGGAAGRALSHAAALEGFAGDERAGEYAAVMEDDFLFTRTRAYVESVLGGALALSPNVVCLGYRIPDSRSYVWAGENLLELRRAFRASCYVVRRGFARRLADVFRAAAAAGEPMDKAWQSLQGRGFYGVYPKAGIERVSFSDVEGRVSDRRARDESVRAARRRMR